MDRLQSARRGTIALVAAVMGMALAIPGTTRDVVRDDILLISSRADAVQVLTAEGFGLVESSWLDGMDQPLLRVKPRGSVADGMDQLAALFPSALIAANEPVVIAAVDYTAGDGAPVLASVLAHPVSRVCGNGVRLGMIDTRVDPGHETLRSRQIVRKSFLDQDAKPAPTDHGTAIASLLVGDPSEALGGLLPGAELYVAEVFKRREDGSLAAELYAVLQALDWMIESRVSVVNMSFETSENPVLSLILSKAVGEGLMLVAAAGNGGPRAAPAYPAAHPQVLAVTAVDDHARAYRHANHGAYIDFSAVGVGVRTASADGFQVQSGTSFAVPAITAAVAELIRRGLDPDPALIRETLREVVQDVGAPGRDEVFGWGVLNIDVCAESERP